MSLLNIASDGYYNVLIALYRAAVDQGPMSKTSLLDLCAPKAGEATERMSQTLNRWTTLGLFDEGDGMVRVAGEVSTHRTTKAARLKKATSDLPGRLRRLVFLPHNNENFWENEGNKASDLTRGLSWLLAQNIYTFPMSSHSAMVDVESRQYVDPERFIVQNNVRWSGLRAWASYLGFLCRSPGQLVDPTAALKEDLPLVFGDRSELTVSEFRQLCAQVLPVLDGGSYRTEVERSLNVSAWSGPTRPELMSTSLSRAIWRLRGSGWIALETRDDAGAVGVLQGPDGRDWASFTHVKLQEAGR
jgi:hypothetical protein